MNIEITDPIGALIVLAVGLLLAWLVTYSAARTATDDLRTVVLALSWTADGADIVIEVANHGMRPAYAVTLRLLAAAAGDPLTVIGEVRPGVSVGGRVRRTALVPDEAGDIPALVRVEWRTTGWRTGTPGGFQRSAFLPLVRATGA